MEQNRLTRAIVCVIISIETKEREVNEMNKIFLDLDGTLARFNVKNALKRFDKEEGFFSNLLAYKEIEIIN